MSLHNEIMNIQLDEESLYYQFGQDGMHAYRLGHTVARHAAAELALKYDAEIEGLNDYIDTLKEYIATLEGSY